MISKNYFQQKRAEYTKARFKKFSYLRHIGQLAQYYFQKRKLNKIAIKPNKEIKLNWFEKLLVAIRAFFKVLKFRTDIK